MKCPSVVVAGSVAALAAAAEPIRIDEPSDDRWMYPANGTPGSRAQAPSFSALPDSGGLDDRWGFFLFAFDTSAVVPAGLDPAAYRIRSITLSAAVGLDDTFDYDPTPDSHLSHGTPTTPAAEADGDPGRPVELSGAGFRNGFTAASFREDSDHGSGAPGTRNAFPLGFDGSAVARDISNNVSEGFDPLVWATGTTDTLDPGDPVPAETEFRFAIDTSLPGVAAYLRQGLADGRLWFTLHSLHSATQGGGERASWLTRDDAIHQLFGGLAPSLSIEVDLALPLQLSRSGTTSRLSWPEFAGFSHELGFSGSPGGDWQVLQRHHAASDGYGSFDHATPLPRGFYRLKLVPFTP